MSHVTTRLDLSFRCCSACFEPNCLVWLLQRVADA